MAENNASRVLWHAIFLHLLFTPPILAQSLPADLKQQSPPTGTIRGRISISHERMQHSSHSPVKGSGRYTSHMEHGASSPELPNLTESLALSDRAAVFLESDALAKQKYALQDRHPVLNQRGLQFHPQVLPILVGTTVDFPNQDNLYHNVFSYSRPKEFDLGRYPRNDSRSVTFDRAGVVRVYCDIHSHMNATVIVLDHPYFAVPLDTGEFVISGIPEGTYMLVFWLDRNEVERRPVQVRSGQSIQVDFTE
jgi:plastocyanin